MLKIKTWFDTSYRRLWALLALIVLIACSRIMSVPAQSVVQGYTADASLQRGMLVQIKKEDSNKVEPVTSSSMDRLHGVVIDPNDAAITLSAEGQKVFVATSGRFVALVSDQNGAIKQNDSISVSSLPGIGMKADTNQPTILGKAANEFDGKTAVINTAEVKVNKATKTVHIGQVLVDINVTANPVALPTQAGLPSFLSKASSSIAGKSVSAPRVYASMAILLVSALISGSMLYAGVRSSLVAIGRNPLSRHAIMHSLLQVTITSLTIFIGGLFGVYLLLKL